jgi:GxxExxY protein
MTQIIHAEESYAIIGACFEVYNQMECGFLEAVYHECLGIEFELRGIPFVSKPRLRLDYAGRTLATYYEADFICFGKILIEIKATKGLCDENRSQVINALNATKFELGLLVNFGHHPKLEYERFALTQSS